jgi:hypothetical protein
VFAFSRLLEQPFIARLLKQIYNIICPKNKFLSPYLCTIFQHELLTIVDNFSALIVNVFYVFVCCSSGVVNNAVVAYVNINLLKNRFCHVFLGNWYVLKKHFIDKSGIRTDFLMMVLLVNTWVS